MATGEAAAAGPDPWNGVGLPVLSDESGVVRYPHAEPTVALRSPVRESGASLPDRLAEPHFPSGRFQRAAQRVQCDISPRTASSRTATQDS